jgi:hypothetical protein
MKAIQYIFNKIEGIYKNINQKRRAKIFALILYYRNLSKEMVIANREYENYTNLNAYFSFQTMETWLNTI